MRKEYQIKTLQWYIQETMPDLAQDIRIIFIRQEQSQTFIRDYNEVVLTWVAQIELTSIEQKIGVIRWDLEKIKSWMALDDDGSCTCYLGADVRCSNGVWYVEPTTPVKPNSYEDAIAYGKQGFDAWYTAMCEAHRRNKEGQ